MKTYNSEDTIICNSMRDFAACIVEHGFLIRPGLAASLCGCNRSYLYRLIEEGRFRKFQIMGELHISQTEWRAWAANRMTLSCEVA